MPEHVFEIDSAAQLRLAIHPRSIAIVGVSGREESLNARPLRFLREHQFAGAIYPVNPGYDELLGLRCYPSLEAIGETVDLVLVLVPASKTADVVRQAGDVGAAMAIVFASGFAEVGPEGRQLQEELAAAGRAAGVRVLGPNCQGLIYSPSGMTATFTAAADRPLDGHSGVAYVGQSGAIGGSVLDLATEMGLGLTAWASTGNQADVDLVEIAGALVEDDNVNVIMLYAEAIEDGAAYTRLAQAAAASAKSLVVLLSGRSTAGKRAAASHTGSMLGDDIGFVLTSRRHGVVMVDDVDELLAVAASLGSRPRATGRRLAVVTTSGGAGSLAADHCVAHGLDLPELSSSTQAALSPLIPDFGSMSNPVDVTAQLFNREGSAEALGSVCRLVADDPQIDAVAVVLTMVTGPLGASIANDLVRTAENLPVPLLVAWLAGLDQTTEGRRIFREAGVPLFSSVGDLTRAAGLLATTPLASAQIEAARPAADTHDLLLRCAAGTATPEEVLTQLGVRHPRTQMLDAGDDVSDTVAGLGGRVAMKISATSLAHKSDIGGVRLDVTPTVAAAVQAELVALATEHRLDGFAGVMVQEMIPPGTEIIIGILSRSDGFAPVLTVGIGGVRTELYRDVVAEIAPVSPARAEQMLRELKGWPLLDGFRGSPAADLAAAVDAIVAVSHALDGWTGDPLELEINPLIVAEKGRGAYAVDLLVTASAADTGSVATSIQK